MNAKLFAYGTLKDQVVQKALFGRTFAVKAAHIENWGLYMAPDGYLFVKTLEGGRVQGILLELDTDDLQRADIWEDLSIYKREICRVFTTEGGEESAYIYTRRSARGELYCGKETHGLKSSDIIRAIRDLFS